eukprot:GHRQ01027789.1.p1 GENE.GHRQ01027789.1~~GHRQ01027789.1.p1  ORF type:complete len:149 (-),score=11.53 GHRQ01027789.1:932-1378(-)
MAVLLHSRKRPLLCLGSRAAKTPYPPPLPVNRVDCCPAATQHSACQSTVPPTAAEAQRARVDLTYDGWLQLQVALVGGDDGASTSHLAGQQSGCCRHSADGQQGKAAAGTRTNSIVGGTTLVFIVSVVLASKTGSLLAYRTYNTMTHG